MQVIPGSKHFPPLPPGPQTAITIGNFDGVHVGHRRLFNLLTTAAEQRDLYSVAITYQPHPVKLLNPEKPVALLFDFQDQARMIQSLGVDYLIAEPFSRELSLLSPQDYFLQFIYEPLKPGIIIVGHDFGFGVNRSGSIDTLGNFARQFGFELMTVPAVTLEGETVSSTRIRQSVADGNVELARKLLARPFYLQGEVVRGAGRGKRLGIPTANLSYEGEIIAKPGVYATWLEWKGKRYPAATNIGFNPTFEVEKATRPMVETHILDFDEQLYGESVRIEFIQRIRDERKFASPEELKRQIQLDIEKSRHILRQTNG